MVFEDYFDSLMPKNYLFNLGKDYEQFIKEYGFVSLDKFVDNSNIIQLKEFQTILRPYYKVYDTVGNELYIVDYPYESDNEIDWYVEATEFKDISKSTGDIYCAGDLYYRPYSSRLMDYKKKICKGDKACPILITKTKQHQN